MCSNGKGLGPIIFDESIRLPEPIVNDDPGDDSTYLDGAGLSDADVREFYDSNVRPDLPQYRPSTAPNADRIEALENGISVLWDGVDELSSRIDQITDRLVKLAVAQAHLRAHLESPKLGLLDRIRVRLGRPIF